MTEPLVVPCVRFRGEVIDVQHMRAHASAWARSLASLPADRLVAVRLTHDPHGVAALFAALANDRPFVALSPDAAGWPEILRSQRITVALPPDSTDLEPACSARGLDVLGLSEGQTGDRLGPLRCPSVVTFTSGSTGTPKAVCRPAPGIFATARAIAHACDLRPGDAILGALPLGGLHGILHGVLLASVLDSEVTLLERVDHRTLLGEFATGRHAFWAGSPHMADLLTRCHLPVPRLAGPRIGRISGSRLSPNTVDVFMSRFGTRLINAYGTVEHGALTQEEGAQGGVARGSSVGRPLPGVRIAVGDRPGEANPPGQEGRIWAQTPWQCLGLGFPPDVPPHPERDGDWIPTADVGWLDDAGRLFLSGRADDLFKTPNGHLVSPALVEDALATHPAVSAVAVVAMPRSVGAAVGAVVERALDAEPVDAPALRLFVAGRVPEWACPQFIAIVDRLPRLPGGKVDRRACRGLIDNETRETGASS